jgi:hypothetical protein
MKTYTLEELEEREINNLNIIKSSNEDNIVKIQSRVDNETNTEELQRLTNLLALHKAHKIKLSKIKPKEIATEKFNKQQYERI